MGPICTSCSKDSNNNNNKSSARFRLKPLNFYLHQQHRHHNRRRLRIHLPERPKHADDFRHEISQFWAEGDILDGPLFDLDGTD